MFRAPKHAITPQNLTLGVLEFRLEMPVEFFEIVFLIAEQFDVVFGCPDFGGDAFFQAPALTIGRTGERKISGVIEDSDVGRVEDAFRRVWAE